MYKKDYIVRQFEEFGKVMAIILGFKHKGEWNRFAGEIEEAVKQFTSIELKEIKSLSQDDFETLINTNTNLKSDQLKILADLLYEQSFAEKEKADRNAQTELFKKSLFLYKLYKNELTANEFNLEVHYRIELLSKLLNQPNPL